MVTNNEYPMATPIELVVSPHVREAIAQLGRTEDVRFSPNNRRLALAGYTANACLVFDIRIQHVNQGFMIRMDDFVELRSNWLRDPHGFDFIGNGILAVANRAGAVTLFRLPSRRSIGRVIDIQPFKVIDQADGAGEPLKTPGSLCVTRASAWYGEVLVCNTFHNRVTQHVFSKVPFGLLDTNAICLECQLDVPDGIAVSPDGRTVAVSNHRQHEILLYDRRQMSRMGKPLGRLTGVDYPHGLRFSPDGKYLYTADAGKPFVHKYAQPPGGWTGVQSPLASARVLSENIFLKGRINPEEGGPKGLDFTRDGRLLAITCEQQPLSIFDEKVLFGGESC